MTRWMRVIGFVMMAASVVGGLACTGAEPGGPAAAAESTSPTPAAGGGSIGTGFVDSGEFAAFPAFLPSTGFAPEVQDCKLGEDPYSTCI